MAFKHMSFQESVTLEDMVIYFSENEWTTWPLRGPVQGGDAGELLGCGFPKDLALWTLPLPFGISWLLLPQKLSSLW